MDMITISAKTLDEAITKALLKLQITSDHLYYEVVEKGSTGLLGFIGAKPCVIRVREKTEEEENASRVEAKAAEKAEQEKKEALKKEAVKKETPKKEPSKKADPVKKDPVKPEAGIAKPADSKPADSDKPEKAEREPAARKERERQPVKADPEVVQSKAKEFLDQVFEAMNIKVTIDTSYDAGEGELSVTMSGDDMGILIGKRGQTLDSLQYLVSLVVNRETEGYLRVKLDTENYRERRKETLETLAKNISFKVKRTKRSVSLEPMNPYERRIIHSALQNDKSIVTRSEGEDPFRHVVVSLKRENYNKR